jgi:hypothetical protein
MQHPGEKGTASDEHESSDPDTEAQESSDDTDQPSVDEVSEQSFPASDPPSY